ncbi:hypothetical protein BDR05DRAFT_950788 [Suillus weaverae]|nr:hypothetical protein BDR05DRAFT_950788 [Suillus weaverae]
MPKQKLSHEILAQFEANGIGSMTVDNTDKLEANLVMDLARARWDVFKAEKLLADCVVQEHKIMTDLSKHQSNVSKKKLDKADIGLGYMQITFKKHSLSLAPCSLCKAIVLVVQSSEPGSDLNFGNIVKVPTGSHCEFILNVWVLQVAVDNCPVMNIWGFPAEIHKHVKEILELAVVCSKHEVIHLGAYSQKPINLDAPSVPPVKSN